MFLEALDAVVKVTIPEPRKFIGRQVGLQIVLNVQVEHPEVEDEKLDGRWPVKRR